MDEPPPFGLDWRGDVGLAAEEVRTASCFLTAAERRHQNGATVAQRPHTIGHWQCMVGAIGEAWAQATIQDQPAVKTCPGVSGGAEGRSKLAQLGPKAAAPPLRQGASRSV